MQWRGRELTEDSWVFIYAPKKPRVVRAGDVPEGSKTSHFEYITILPTTVAYRWPTERELIEHFGKTK